MRLGKALATGIAEEAPREVAEPEVDVQRPELKTEAVVDTSPEPVEVPAVR
ncbi:hypothetical protein [Streptomyces sp. cg35]|uniref:hypothetical protein n=1 Tax=Streptomyces sp. cg35 TaxID=3421650 RepID=UPI003D17A39C